MAIGSNICHDMSMIRSFFEIRRTAAKDMYIWNSDSQLKEQKNRNLCRVASVSVLTFTKQRVMYQSCREETELCMSAAASFTRTPHHQLQILL